MKPQDLVARLEDVWSSVAALAHELDASDWDRTTDCPGWSVKDHLAHMADIECQLAGRPQPAHTVDDKPWIRNDFGKATEVGVDRRRPLPPGEVLAEFEDVTAERLAQLRALDTSGWEAETMTPVGPGPYSLFMQVRVLDCWVHEQDMRRAVGRPGHLEGPAGELVTDRLLLSFPMVVGKRAAAPDGSTVVIRLTGPVEREVAVGVNGGRGAALDVVPNDPTAAIAMGSESFAVLANGRQTPDQRDDITLAGDTALAAGVVANLNIMF